MKPFSPQDAQVVLAVLEQGMASPGSWPRVPRTRGCPCSWKCCLWNLSLLIPLPLQHPQSSGRGCRCREGAGAALGAVLDQCWWLWGCDPCVSCLHLTSTAPLPFQPAQEQLPDLSAQNCTFPFVVAVSHWRGAPGTPGEKGRGRRENRARCDTGWE